MDPLLNPELLPDLNQAEVIELKNYRFKKFAHIEYVNKPDGSVLRVCRPFGDWPIFLVPITSLVNEYAKDIEIIRQSQLPMFPKTHSNDHPDEERDNDYCNSQCFSNVVINTEE